MNPFYGYPAYPGQQRLADQPRFAQPPAYAPGLRGRMVMGVEEARAAQIDFDGSVSYFPSPAEGKIYAKSIDLNGMPVFLTYELKEPQQPVAVEASALTDVTNRLSAVEKYLEDLGYGKPNANAGNAPAK